MEQRCVHRYGGTERPNWGHDGSWSIQCQLNAKHDGMHEWASGDMQLSWLPHPQAIWEHLPVADWLEPEWR